jgi:predicted nucleotidyltransferase component of viral defense system
MNLDYAKHKSIMLQILKDVYSDTSIAPYLGFKGGTAALLFYGLPRYSNDLDFDLLNLKQEDEIFDKLHKICLNYGKVDPSVIKHYTLLNIISYANGAQRIKVEVNRRNFGSSFKPKTLLGISMLVMTKEDMFANKLVAMKERVGKTSRDVFDAHYFLKQGWGINIELVEARTGKPYKEVLKDCINLLEKLDNRHILDGLGELLTDAQKDWARAKLKDDTMFLLKIAAEQKSK